jgi:regulator of cell morphogenesis and NO signaling
MNAITKERTVGDVVAERISRSRVLEKHGIDYCCGGDSLLADACTSKGIPFNELLSELDEVDSAESPMESVDYNSMPLEQLIDHIVTTHHAYLRQELPRLLGLAEKVAVAHADHDPRVLAIEAVVSELMEELMSHMGKEEHILFPFIQELAQTGTVPFFPFGSLADPINVMESEHQGAGDALHQLRKLTDDYSEPDWACNTCRVLFEGLRDLELDLHQHIHKENNILFPNALILEQQYK